MEQEILEGVLYERASLDPSGAGLSVDKQHRENLRTCEVNGWEVVAHFCDNNRSATRYAKKGRPEYEKLAGELRPGRVLVTCESSRLTRDLKFYVALRDLCAERGAKLCYRGRLYDLNRGDDRFATGLDALVAEREAELIRDRIQVMHRDNLREGKAHGRLPFGYRIIRDPNSGRALERVPHETQAPFVIEATERVLAGERLMTVQADLIARGAELQPGRLRRVLLNPAYAGYRTHRGEIVREGSNWEPLISLEQHQRLVTLLTDPKRVTHRGTAVKHLLSKIARCSVCGSTLSRRKNKARRDTHKPGEFYGCPQSHVGRDITKADVYVTEVLIALLSNREAFEKLTMPDAAPDLVLAGKAEALRQRMRGVVRAVAKGEMSNQLAGEIEEELRPELEAAEAEEQAARNAHYTSPTVLTVVGDNAREEWEQLTLLEKRDVIRNTVQVVVNPLGKSRWHSDIGITVTPLTSRRPTA